MKRHVLFILPALHGGGAERALLRLLRQLDRAKIQPALFVVKKEGALLDHVPADVEVTTALEPGERIRSHPCRVFSRLLKAARSCDLIVGALEFGATYLSLAAGRVLRRPVIGMVRTHPASELATRGILHRLAFRLAYPHLTTAVTVSAGARRSLVELVPSLKGRTRVIHNLLPIQEIRALAKETPETPFSPDRPVVLAAGRLVPLKQFDMLIRAHAEVLSRNVEHHLVILGEGPERPNLESLARELGVEKSVSLPGFQVNPYAWMARANLLVLTSRYEGFPNVLLEAMALGVPVAATDCPSGPAEILAGGEYGLLVPPDDVNAPADAIARVLTDSQLAARLRRKGSRRALDFSADVIAHQYEKLFLEVCGARARRNPA